jgi:hypothetical protein
VGEQRLLKRFLSHHFQEKMDVFPVPSVVITMISSSIESCIDFSTKFAMSFNVYDFFIFTFYSNSHFLCSLSVAMPSPVSQSLFAP